MPAPSSAQPSASDAPAVSVAWAPLLAEPVEPPDPAPNTATSPVKDGLSVVDSAPNPPAASDAVASPDSDAVAVTDSVPEKSWRIWESQPPVPEEVVVPLKSPRSFPSHPVLPTDEGPADVVGDATVVAVVVCTNVAEGVTAVVAAVAAVKTVGAEVAGAEVAAVGAALEVVAAAPTTAAVVTEVRVANPNNWAHPNFSVVARSRCCTGNARAAAANNKRGRMLLCTSRGQPLYMGIPVGGAAAVFACLGK